MWCGDAARRRARAIAIRGDRIVAVGTDDDVRAFRGPATEVLSLPGRMVVPGFQDAHVHPSVGARNLLNVNLDDLHTKQDYLDAHRGTWPTRTPTSSGSSAAVGTTPCSPRPAVRARRTSTPSCRTGPSSC